MQETEASLKNEDTKEATISLAKSEKEKQTGNDYIRAKEYDLALECYNRSIFHNSKNAASYFNRSLVYLKQKKFNKAVDDCNQAVLLKKDYIKAYHRRAKAYIELKEYDLAINDLLTVLEKESQNSEANAELKKCRDEKAKIGGYKRISIVEVQDDDENEENEETSEEKKINYI